MPNAVVQRRHVGEGCGLGQGRDAVKQLLDDNPDLMEEIEARVKEAIAEAINATTFVGEAHNLISVIKEAVGEANNSTDDSDKEALSETNCTFPLPSS